MKLWTSELRSNIIFTYFHFQPKIASLKIVDLVEWRNLAPGVFAPAA